MSRRILLAALAATVSLSTFAAEEKFELDPTHTYPHFEVNHLGFSTMRGIFSDTKGTLTLDRAAKTGQIEAVVSTTSVDTGMGKRDEHLRSKDFFNVAEFPSMTFKADKFSYDGENPVSADGTLTLLGVTKPVKLTIVPTKCGMRMDQKYICGADVSTTINRSDWGMKTYVPFISDAVKITIEVEAARL